MNRASYKKGIAFVALNDEPGLSEVEDVVGMVTISLLADLFGVTVERVAHDVVQYQRRLL